MAQSTEVASAAPALVQQDRPNNPFERSRDKSLAAGTVEIESSRAVAEAQAKLLIAQRFPRDPYSAWQRVMDACRRPGLAESAIYSYKRGGEAVSGPSIRLAEELARCWGNIDYGLRELSNRDGLSEMEAYAWDLETNTISTQRFTVRHIRDTKDGGRALNAQRDIYEITANMGARRLRARILAILPDDVKDMAVAECRRTIAGEGDEPIGDRIKRMVAVFGKLGVTSEQLEQRLGHPLKQIVPEELADLQGIYTSIRDGQSGISDWFGAAKLAEPEADAKQPEKPKADKPKAAEKKAESKPAEQTKAPPRDEEPEIPASLDRRSEKAKPVQEPHDPETGELLDQDNGDGAAMAQPETAPAKSEPKPAADEDKDFF